MVFLAAVQVNLSFFQDTKMVNPFGLRSRHIKFIDGSKHIKLCLLLWFEFFRTIALLLGVLGDFIVGLFKTGSASAESRRESFGRENFHPRLVSLGIMYPQNLETTNGARGRGRNSVAQLKGRPAITI